MNDETDTWQEGQIWYAAPSDYSPDAPVGKGETEEDAILNLKHQIEDLNKAWLEAWEARNDEP
jgi:hypothetical protein